MPSLDWIGKSAVVGYHNSVPFRLLRCEKRRSFGEVGTGNLLVQGDNLEALKALLPYYASSVKCIYIDPPYNTGVDERGAEGKRTGWTYSDNVNNPQVQQWLNRVVGPESEDLSRHDKWLCMMYPRIALLHQFLKPDGVIFVSIDEIEYGSLRLVLDEIFGVPNRVGTIIWKNATDNNPTNISLEHEYILCYARDKRQLPAEWKSSTLAIKEKLIQIGQDFIEKYPNQEKRQAAYTAWFRENKSQLWQFDRYKYIDEGGIYTGSQSVHNPGKEGYRYDIIHPKTKRPCDQPLMGYRFPKETMDQMLAEKRILFGETEEKIVEIKVYAHEYRAKLSSFFELDGRIGTNEIKALFPEDKRPFDFPKPTALIEELLSFITSGSDIVLDSFAGSGTTGHATINLNKADGQERRFLLIETKESIAKNITAERIKRVYGKLANKELQEKGISGFRYCTLGPSLFGETGQIREEVSFDDMAAHIYFTETGEPISRRPQTKSPLLGVHNGRAIYLLFNGILGDVTKTGGNVLTPAMVKKLPPHAGQRIIYGEGCLLSNLRLTREAITFKQIPYRIRTS